MATEHDHLAQAIRHIARAEEMVTEQRDLIERMSEHGHDTKLAENLLHTMRNTLNQMYEHRAMIEAAIAAGRR
jgi:uncharacterized protein (UPF0335 family)